MRAVCDVPYILSTYLSTDLTTQAEGCEDPAVAAAMRLASHGKRQGAQGHGATRGEAAAGGG